MPRDIERFWRTTQNLKRFEYGPRATTNVQVQDAIDAAVPGPSATLPLMDGVAAVGVAATWGRGDHVHPSDTSRYAASNPAGYQTAAQVTASLAPYAPLASPALTGNPTSPTPATADSDTSIATTAYVQAQGYATAATVTAGDNLRVLKSGDTMNGNLTTGSGVGAGDATLEIGGGRAGSGSAYIDMHAASGTDYEFRLLRDVGPNGAVRMTNNGTGPFQLENAGGVRVAGTGTNDNAPAGFVGEYIANTATAVSLTDGALANITSIVLTAGDWAVGGSVYYTPAGTTALFRFMAGSSAVSATLPAIPFYVRFAPEGAGPPAGSAQCLVIPEQRYSLSATTTVYLVTQTGFTTSTMTCTGHIHAIRMR